MNRAPSNPSTSTITGEVVATTQQIAVLNNLLPRGYRFETLENAKRLTPSDRKTHQSVLLHTSIQDNPQPDLPISTEYKKVVEEEEDGNRRHATRGGKHAPEKVSEHKEKVTEAIFFKDKAGGHRRCEREFSTNESMQLNENAKRWNITDNTLRLSGTMQGTAGEIIDTDSDLNRNELLSTQRLVNESFPPLTIMTTTSNTKTNRNQTWHKPQESFKLPIEHSNRGEPVIFPQKKFKANIEDYVTIPEYETTSITDTTEDMGNYNMKQVEEDKWGQELWKKDVTSKKKDSLPPDESVKVIPHKTKQKHKGPSGRFIKTLAKEIIKTVSNYSLQLNKKHRSKSRDAIDKLISNIPDSDEASIGSLSESPGSGTMEHDMSKENKGKEKRSEDSECHCRCKKCRL